MKIIHTHTLLCRGFAPRKHVAYFNGIEPPFYLCWAEYLRLTSYSSNHHFSGYIVQLQHWMKGSQGLPMWNQQNHSDPQLNTKEEKERLAYKNVLCSYRVAPRSAPLQAQAQTSKDHGVLDSIQLFFNVSPDQRDNKNMLQINCGDGLKKPPISSWHHKLKPQ